MGVERWSGSEARAALANPDLDRLVGVARGVAGVVVDLDDDPGADIAAAFTRLPVVAVGHGSVPAAAWDIATTDPDPVVAGIDASPIAAVVAAQTLRLTASLSTHDGLQVESLAYATLQAGAEFRAWVERQGRKVRNDDAPRLVVTDDGDTATITLDRPRLRNLLDARMRDELVDALRVLALDPDRPIRIVGAGPAFCAGGDPAEFGTVADAAVAHTIRSSANVAPWLAAVADRTAAFVHGPCVGAGVELAAFCHRVTASDDARFRLPETRMGLMPGAGGTVSIPRRIGRQRTLEWLLRDVEIDAATAHEWGLVDDID
ncbi:MAG: enoyl-CoA hydratase/isomerase family protein [Acidimicrobiales bacterium]